MAVRQTEGGTKTGRDPNLDLLRASAIGLVLLFHISWACDDLAPVVRQITSLGGAGVDLFFVLSGWLIGGLWWREWQQHRDVRIARFLGRRWLRTLPPYYAALALSWTAVYVQRREPFDAGFLLFFQNYYEQIPFFTVSWSLCIEEHFYLLLPWILWAASRQRAIGAIVAVAALALPMVLRWPLFVRYGEMKMGYMFAATHLHCEGLTLGVIASGIAVLRPRLWERIQGIARWLVIPALLLFLSMMLWPPRVYHAIGFTALALIWITVLAAVASRQPIPGANHRLVYWISIASYSVYLVHVLVLHAARQVLEHVGMAAWYIYVPLALLGITAFGGLFHVALERSSIHIRDRLLPRRAPSALPQPAPPAAADSHVG